MFSCSKIKFFSSYSRNIAVSEEREMDNECLHFCERWTEKFDFDIKHVCWISFGTVSLLGVLHTLARENTLSARQCLLRFSCASRKLWREVMLQHIVAAVWTEVIVGRYCCSIVNRCYWMTLQQLPWILLRVFHWLPCSNLPWRGLWNFFLLQGECLFSVIRINKSAPPSPNGQVS